MADASLPAKGRFVWYDLITSQTDQARAFYSRLLGWQTRDQQMDRGPYVMWMAGERGVGGLVDPGPEPAQPSHWLAYVMVPSVEATCEKATKLGGELRVPVTEVPGVGRFAIIADPQGAVIAPFSFVGEAPAEAAGPGQTGHFCWNELLTTDPGQARRFYKEIFDWAVGEMDMGELGTYWIFRRGEREEAGLMAMPPDAEAPPFWLPYVAVNEVDRTARRCAELGGQIHLQPMDVPGIGRFAVLADPAGASFAVFRREG